MEEEKVNMNDLLGIEAERGQRLYREVRAGIALAKNMQEVIAAYHLDKKPVKAREMAYKLIILGRMIERNDTAIDNKAMKSFFMSLPKELGAVMGCPFEEKPIVNIPEVPKPEPEKQPENKSQ